MPITEAIAPSFFVGDLGQSIDWYVRVLGFEVAWRATDHARVRLGPALIVLVQPKIEGAGQRMTAPPADRSEYGMREAAVRDPDGNDIYIAQQL
jgi:hypothetical protein